MTSEGSPIATKAEDEELDDWYVSMMIVTVHRTSFLRY